MKNSKSVESISSIPRSPSAFEFEDIEPASVLNVKHYLTPHLRDLKAGEPKDLDTLPAAELGKIELENKEHRYGWIIGVFFPVLVNLLCVTYYIDLTNHIATIGWGKTAIFYLVSLGTSLGTLISICVFSTNGEMRDGGLYYLISRTLGPRIGNTAGIILIIAHISAISSRVHRFGTDVEYIFNLYSHETNNYEVYGIQLLAYVAAVTLAILSPHILTLSLAPLGIITILGGVLSTLGLVVSHPTNNEFLTKPSLKHLENNFDGHAAPLGFFFGLLFPASNSLLAVSNFGGSLNKPRSQVPLGGLTASILCSIMCVCALCIQPLCYDFTASSKDTKFLFIDSSISPILSAIGFGCATFGAILTLCAGGARVVIAMAEDGSLPSQFKNRTVTHISMGVLSLALSFWPSGADNLTRTFFPIPYSLINYAVYTAASAHYPGFRPGFKLYNKYLALFLAFIHICQALCNGYYTLFLIPVFFLSYYFYKNFPDVWGTVTQTRFFYDALDNCLSLYHRKPHPKTYRPGIFYITTEHPDSIAHVIHFLNEIEHGTGMIAVGRVTKNATWDDLQTERESVRLDHGAFYSVTSSSTFLDGATDLISLVGIGNMRPDIIALPFYEHWQAGDMYPLTEYIGLIHEAMVSGYSCAIFRNLDFTVDIEGTIDVWWLHDDGGLTLLLPFLLSQNKRWKKCQLRVIIFASSVDGDDIDTIQLEMIKYLYLVRISAEVMVVDVDFLKESPTPLSISRWKSMTNHSTDVIDMQTKRNLLIADLVRQISFTASFISISLPLPDESVNKNVYMSWIDMISCVPVPVMLIRGTGESVLNSKI